MPTFTFMLNGASTSVTTASDEPLLWVLRDVLGVTGPKYGCGVGVCKACTSHLDGQEIHVKELATRPQPLQAHRVTEPGESGEETQ